MKTEPLVSLQRIERAIYQVRGQKIMMDSDLAQSDVSGRPANRLSTLNQL